MNSNLQILEREFKRVEVDLLKNHNALGMRSSGNWGRSLSTEVKFQENNYNAVIYGARYTGALVFGRKPTAPNAKESSPNLYTKILEWIQYKGIKPRERKMKVTTLAYLITRSIHKKGTQYYRDGGTELVSKVVTPERIQGIIDKIGVASANAIAQAIGLRFSKLKSKGI